MTAEAGQLRWLGDQAIVAVPAEVDIINAGEVRRVLLAAASHGAAVLIIDMSGTTFCDSAGVQAIIDTHNRAAATHTQLRLVAAAVLRILTIVGVDQLIPIYPTLEAALAGGPTVPASAREPDDPKR
jgi:anti-sigma B factor antagonist